MESFMDFEDRDRAPYTNVEHISGVGAVVELAVSFEVSMFELKHMDPLVMEDVLRRRMLETLLARIFEVDEEISKGSRGQQHLLTEDSIEDRVSARLKRIGRIKFLLLETKL